MWSYETISCSYQMPFICQGNTFASYSAIRTLNVIKIMRLLASAFVFAYLFNALHNCLRVGQKSWRRGLGSWKRSVLGCCLERSVDKLCVLSLWLSVTSLSRRSAYIERRLKWYKILPFPVIISNRVPGFRHRRLLKILKDCANQYDAASSWVDDPGWIDDFGCCRSSAYRDWRRLCDIL